VAEKRKYEIFIYFVNIPEYLFEQKTAHDQSSDYGLFYFLQNFSIFALVNLYLIPNNIHQKNI